MHGRRHRPGSAPSVPWSVELGDAPAASRDADRTRNVAYALDRHVEAGNGDRAALVYGSLVTGTNRTYTYSELRDEVGTLSWPMPGRPGVADKISPLWC